MGTNGDRIQQLRLLALAGCLALAALAAHAQSGDVRDATLAQGEQLERLRQLQREAERSVPQQATRPEYRWQNPVDAESPCFVVHQVWIESAERAGTGGQSDPLVGPVQRLGRFEGACLGVGSIEVLRSNLQARLQQQGYITSALVVPPQDVSTGTLVLRLIPGRVESVAVDVVAGATGSARPADRKSTRLNSSHSTLSRMPSSA